VGKRRKALREGFTMGPWGFIPVYSRGHTKFAIINADDYAEHCVHNWTEDRGYAVRWERRRDGRYRKVSLHREINRTPAGRMTDHINGDRLDNRRRNLRDIDASKNGSNKSRMRNNRTGVPGVHRTKRGRYRAAITYNYKRVPLGSFATLQEAAHMRAFAEWLMPGRFPRHWLNPRAGRALSKAA
jgi:hypothetical protein